jgi:hypothetical protein
MSIPGQPVSLVFAITSSFRIMSTAEAGRSSLAAAAVSLRFALASVDGLSSRL